MSDEDDLRWFAVRGHWIIRRVPNTKDKYYIACGHPPARILKIYNITEE